MSQFDVSNEQSWSSSIRSTLSSLPESDMRRLHERYGTSTLEEVVDLHRARYPRVNRDGLPTRVSELLGSVLGLADGDGPSYEKGPTHDKEPYDKDHGYDKQGFSRT